MLRNKETSLCEQNLLSFLLHFLYAGNADGMGSIRKDELYRACAVHKVFLLPCWLSGGLTA